MLLKKPSKINPEKRNNSLIHNSFTFNGKTLELHLTHIEGHERDVSTDSFRKNLEVGKLCLVNTMSVVMGWRKTEVEVSIAEGN